MMKLKIAKWAVVIAVIIALTSWANKSKKEDCEVKMAKELGAATKYIDGRCMAKGYATISGW